MWKRDDEDADMVIMPAEKSVYLIKNGQARNCEINVMGFESFVIMVGWGVSKSV